MKKIMLRYEAEQLSINCEKFINTFMAYFIKDNELNIENMSCEEFEIYKEMISLMKKSMEYSVHQAQKLDYIEDHLCEIERKLREKKIKKTKERGSQGSFSFSRYLHPPLWNRFRKEILS